MGRTTTPQYRLVLTERGRHCTMAWRGRATRTRLERWISQYIDSLQIGGANAHLSRALGYIPIPDSAQIIRQADNTVLAWWKAPAFMAF